MQAPRALVFGFVVVAALAGAAIGGCGVSSHRTPSLAGLPLVPGAQVEVSKRTCDRGGDAYCSLQVVVVAARYRTSVQLLRAERRLLRHRHWSRENAPTGLENAADAPSDRLRVIYATAGDDLRAIDQGWIKRAKPVTLALAHDLFSNASTLSMLVTLGTG